MTQTQYLDCIFQFKLDIVSGAIGAILIVGAFRRWKWLVDPPLGLSPYYSQARMKEMFGPTAVLYFTYFLGLVFLASGGYATYRHVQWCRLYSQSFSHSVRPSN